MYSLCNQPTIKGGVFLIKENNNGIEEIVTKKKNDIKERLIKVFSEQFAKDANLKNEILATVDKSITLENIDRSIDTDLSNTIKMQLLDYVLNKHFVAIDDTEKKNIIKYAGFNSMQPTHIWFESSHSLENFDLFLKGLDLMISNKIDAKKIKNEHTLKVKTEENKIKIEDYKFKSQRYKSGSFYGFYKGQAKKGNIKHGYGVLELDDRRTFAQHKLKFVGEIYNNEFLNGKFKLDEAEIELLDNVNSSDIYNAEVTSVKDSELCLKMKKGDKYKGHIKEGNLPGMFSFEGEGTYTFANGATFNGNWKNNKLNGDGTLTLANGTVINGQWVNDKLISTDNTEQSNDINKSIRQIVDGNPVVQEVKTVQVVGEIVQGSQLSDVMNHVFSSIHSTVNLVLKTLNDPLVNCFKA